MTRKKRSEPDQDRILDAAEKAGIKYANDQLGSDYFHEWVREQMFEAEQMRRSDPSSVLPLETKSHARKIARNMLQQLEWDTKRELNVLDYVPGAKDLVAPEEVVKKFYEGFDWALHGDPAPGDQRVEDWLADEILELNREAREKVAPETREAKRAEALTPEQRDVIVTALRHYGADLSSDGFITHGGKTLSVRPEVKKGRLRMISTDGSVQATYPASNLASGVADFVESFWYWKPQATEAREGRLSKRGPRVTQDQINTLARDAGRKGWTYNRWAFSDEMDRLFYSAEMSGLNIDLDAAKAAHAEGYDEYLARSGTQAREAQRTALPTGPHKPREPKTRKEAEARIVEIIEQARTEMRQGGWNEFNHLKQEAVYLAYKWKLEHTLPDWIKRHDRGVMESRRPVTPYYSSHRGRRRH
jgi:hypothetical protein